MATERHGSKEKAKKINQLNLLKKMEWKETFNQFLLSIAKDKELIVTPEEVEEEVEEIIQNP